MVSASATSSFGYVASYLFWVGSVGGCFWEKFLGGALNGIFPHHHAEVGLFWVLRADRGLEIGVFGAQDA